MSRGRAGLLIALLALASATPTLALSPEDEVRVGRQVVADVRPFELTADPSLDAIGARLVQVAERKELPWRFWVIEGMEGYNAFAAPGGFVFITRKYYEKLNDDEAAFVIGHEIAHIDLRHYEKQVRRRHRADLGHLLINVITKGEGAWSTAADLGATAYVTHYSRALEKEADLTGYHYAEAAGYNARAAVSALAKLGEQPNLHPWIVNIFSTHPLLSSREDRLAALEDPEGSSQDPRGALGDEEPEAVTRGGPSPSHRRDLTQGLQPFDPAAPIAVRILAPDGTRWENRWRKNFTKRLHLRLVPLGFEIAGDDVMYKPDIGDPVEMARSRGARYLVLVTVHKMETAQTAGEQPGGTPVRALVDVAAALVDVEQGSVLWEGRFSEEKQGVDVLEADREILYPDTCVGALVSEAASEIALGCAKAAGAKLAEPPPSGSADEEPRVAGEAP
jgi:Zn-dependent protease with chaperone function